MWTRRHGSRSVGTFGNGPRSQTAHKTFYSYYITRSWLQRSRNPSLVYGLVFMGCAFCILALVHLAVHAGPVELRIQDSASRSDDMSLCLYSPFPFVLSFFLSLMHHSLLTTHALTHETRELDHNQNSSVQKSNVDWQTYEQLVFRRFAASSLSVFLPKETGFGKSLSRRPEG